MKEDHDVMNDEELKRFFLNEALLLCPSARLETGECEKLWILRGRLKRMNKFLGMLYHQQPEEFLMEMQEVFGFYFVEKNESKKKKLRMNDHLGAYVQSVNRMAKYSDLVSHYYLYGVRHVKTLERLMEFYFPDEFRKKREEEMLSLETNAMEEEGKK